jgi:hypothetical protein
VVNHTSIFASCQQPEQLPTPTWSTGLDPAAYFGWRG